MGTVVLGKLIRKLRSRSSSEIRFRLGQEFANVRMLAAPPVLTAEAVRQVRGPLPLLPPPEDVLARLQGTSFAAGCVRLADRILEHRIPLLGGELETGLDIRWRRDYTSGRETETIFFRRIPYLDATRAGDHKNIWELSRHQYLVVLAQAHLFTRQPRYLEELVRQLESWFAENPFQRGINWASALEVAFRALSWIWIYQLAGDGFSDPFRRRFLEGLYQHGLHLQANLSYYFSPNTHLLGEAVALHALGRLFPQFPAAGEWVRTGGRVVRNELDRQVFSDGCHFELSTYYHVYALDMFLFHAILQGFDEMYRLKLTRMAEFLDQVTGDCGVLPYFGDDDGGRFFHPYGERNRFGLATLATCGVCLDRQDWIRDPALLQQQAAWWLAALPAAVTAGERPPAKSVRFPDSGLVVMAAGEIQLITDTGPFGPGNAGHTHADTLSLVLRVGDEQVLIDPGTYTYVGDPLWRNRFRGTAAHNTIRVDGADQAQPGDPFVWLSRPRVEVVRWESSAARDLLIAACSYAGVRHRRTILLDKNGSFIFIADRVEGGEGEHRVEQFWHFGVPVRKLAQDCFEAGSKVWMSLGEGSGAQLSEGGEYGWRSEVLGVKTAAPLLSLERRTAFPVTYATLLDCSGRHRSASIKWNAGESSAECIFNDGTAVSLILE